MAPDENALRADMAKAVFRAAAANRPLKFAPTFSDLLLRSAPGP